jgi:hypothetical protein
VPLLLVEKLVANDSAHSSEEAKNKSKLEVLPTRCWFQLEPSIWDVNLVTDYDQSP